MSDSEIDPHHWIIAKFGFAYDDELNCHLELLDKNELFVEVVQLAHPSFFAKFASNAVEAITSLTFEVVVGQFKVLNDELQRRADFQSLLPKESDYLAQHRRIEQCLTQFTVALRQYEQKYTDFVQELRKFDSSSLNRGMTWSSITGGVAATFLGPLGAVIGGLLGVCMSDALAMNNLKAQQRDLDVYYLKMIKAYREAGKDLWRVYFAPIDQFLEARDQLMASVSLTNN